MWQKQPKSIRSVSTGRTLISSISLPHLGHRGGCGTSCMSVSAQGSSPATAWTLLVGTKTPHWFRSLKGSRQNEHVSIKGYCENLTLNYWGLSK